jgi:hypothetical protein
MNSATLVQKLWNYAQGVKANVIFFENEVSARLT